MKQKVINFSALLSMLAFIWSCDNGYTDFPIVDTAPKITLSSVLSGLTEGEDFKIDVTLSDGVDNGTISTLANFSYAVTKGGATVKSGSQELSGESQTINLVIGGGFEPGQYNLDIKATDSNGNEGTENLSFTVASSKPAFDISGVWSMEPISGAMKVGPAPGSSEWWQNSDGDVTARACFFDDKYTFNADGTFKIDMGDQTWLEQWQGVAADGCGVPKAPFDGAGSFTYTYTSTTLTLIGTGAHIGLSKVNNAGEISNGAAIANQIAYTIVEQTKVGNTRKMTLRIQAGNGVWWDFKLISGAASPSASIVGKWKMEPIEGALAVGPSAGSNEWWFNKTADVTARACFFDDVYTFGADGSFTLEMGGSTWLETWQGASEGCGTPKAPHDGNGSFTYQFTGTSLKLIGKGAHVALPKAVNTGELPNTAVPNDVTYKVASITEDGGKKKMTLQIEAGTGVWWTFKLISE